MLFALLLGMAFYFLSQEGPCVAGIEFASKRILRVAVGARTTIPKPPPTPVMYAPYGAPSPLPAPPFLTRPWEFYPPGRRSPLPPPPPPQPNPSPSLPPSAPPSQTYLSPYLPFLPPPIRQKPNPRRPPHHPSPPSPDPPPPTPPSPHFPSAYARPLAPPPRPHHHQLLLPSRLPSLCQSPSNNNPTPPRRPHPDQKPNRTGAWARKLARQTQL